MAKPTLEEGRSKESGLAKQCTVYIHASEEPGHILIGFAFALCLFVVCMGLLRPVEAPLVH